MADLAVVHVDDKGDRRLRIYSFVADAWAPSVETTLRPEVQFVDVANIAGLDRLITYEPGRLNWFDPEPAKERELAAVTCDFEPPSKGRVLHVDVTHDVNGDGYDDLVVPDGFGFRVFVQQSDGEFADPVRVGPSFGRPRVYGADGYRYDPWSSGRVHEADYNHDGRGDLIFWNPGSKVRAASEEKAGFEVHLQNEAGLFEAETRRFTAEVAFDSDEFAALAAPEPGRARDTDYVAARDLAGRVLRSIADHNGDGIADLAVFSLEGPSMFRKRSTYEVHFGTPVPGGTVFASAISTAIESKGIPFGIEGHDFDQDGQVDLMLTTVRPTVFKMVGIALRALLARTLSIELEFHRLEGGLYAQKPGAVRQIKADLPPKEAGGEDPFFPAVLIGDVNGDGHSELLMGRSERALHVYRGVPGPELFAEQATRIGIAMPRDEEHTWLVDLNGDGKQDLLMHYPAAREPQRVAILVAR